VERFTREYSKRLGVLTGAKLQAALDRFGLGRLLDAQPAPGGLFGQNVFLTASSGEFVLRGCPHYDGQLQKERFFSRLISERTRATAPWPFQIERSPDLFGWSYALMPRLPGVALSDPALRDTLAPADRLAIARAMGEHLALLHQTAFPAPAVYDHAVDDLAPLPLEYPDWLVGNLRQWLARCRAASERTTDADVAWIESEIAAARDALSEPFAPVIVHTDYAEGNVVAQRVGDAWRITGVFDLGEAYVGDGEYDLARCAAARGGSLAAAFIGAYTAQRPRAGFAERFRVHMLLDRLIIWQYGQRNRVWFEPETTFREWAERYVSTRVA
jgi:aminoglycoside phosphotransferase (APT) family kinase protein